MLQLSARACVLCQLFSVRGTRIQGQGRTLACMFVHACMHACIQHTHRMNGALASVRVIVLRICPETCLKCRVVVMFLHIFGKFSR